MLKKDLLKKMQMPAKKADPMLAMDEKEMDLGSEAAPGDEMPMEDMPAAPVEAGALADIPDEDLIAEMKKRGLSMEQEEAMEGEDMPLEEMPEDEEMA